VGRRSATFLDAIARKAALKQNQKYVINVAFKVRTAT